MHQNNILLGTVTPKILGALNANCSNMVKGADFKFDPSDSPVHSLLLHPLPPHLPQPRPLTLFPNPSFLFCPLPPPIPLLFSTGSSPLMSLPSAPAPSLPYSFAPHLPIPFSSTSSFPLPLLSSPSIFPSRSVLLMPLTLSSAPSILSLHSLLPYPFPHILPLTFSPAHCLFPAYYLLGSSPNPSLLPQPFSLPITLPKLTHNLHIYTYANT